MKFNNLLERALFETVNKRFIGDIEDIVYENNFIMHHFISNGKLMSLSINFDGSANVFMHKGDIQYEYTYNHEQYIKAAKRIRKWQGFNETK